MRHFIPLLIIFLLTGCGAVGNDEPKRFEECKLKIVDGEDVSNVLDHGDYDVEPSPSGYEDLQVFITTEHPFDVEVIDELEDIEITFTNSKGLPDVVADVRFKHYSKLSPGVSYSFKQSTFHIHFRKGELGDLDPYAAGYGSQDPRGEFYEPKITDSLPCKEKL